MANSRDPIINNRGNLCPIFFGGSNLEFIMGSRSRNICPDEGLVAPTRNREGFYSKFNLWIPLCRQKPVFCPQHKSIVKRFVLCVCVIVYDCVCDWTIKGYEDLIVNDCVNVLNEK